MNSLKRKIGFVLVFAILALVLSIITSTYSSTTYAAFPGENGKIAFQARFKMFTNGEIWTMEPNGSAQEYLIDGFNPSWSPGGTQITFTRFIDNSHEIWKMTESGAKQKKLVDGVESAWCSDDKIVFVSDRDSLYADIYIMKMKANGRNVERLTSDPERDRRPACSSDGSQIAFTSYRDGNPEIYVMDADGTNKKRMTNNPGADDNADWSPDGTRIVYSCELLDNDEICVMNLLDDGGNPENLTKHSASDKMPAWSPDGMKISFVSNRDGNQEIYVMATDGSNPIRLTDTVVNYYHPDWQPLTLEQQITPIIVDIEELVSAGVLNDGKGNSLIVKLDGILKKLNEGKAKPACKMMGAFTNQVTAFIDAGILTTEQGQPLIDAVDSMKYQFCE